MNAPLIADIMTVKALIISILLFSFEARAEFFQIQNWKGEPELSQKGKTLDLKRHMVLEKHALIHTKKGTWLRLQTPSGEVAILQPESELEITSEGGLLLREGQLRVEAKSKLAFTSPVSAHHAKSSSTALFNYYPLYGKSELRVLKGEVSSQLLGFAETTSITAKAGDLSVAKAVVDDEGPVFDTFLGGKIRVRGKLEELTKFGEGEPLLAKTELKAWMPPPPRAADPTAGPGEICAKPFAKYNQCLWTCVGARPADIYCDLERQGVYCQRKRCNGNGQWEEESRLPASQRHNCQGPKPVIATCDY